MTKLVFNALTGTFDLVQNLSGYALLAGRAGGQVLVGGSAVTDALVLQGTSGNGTLASPSVQLKVGNNGGTVAMTALNNGNVGIGTTTPLAALDVNGVTRALSSAGTAPTGGIGLEYFYKASTDTGNIYSYDRTNSIYKDLNLNDKVRIIGSSGKVGIGTTTPAGILDVRGDTAASGSGTAINLYAQNAGAGTYAGGNINLVPGTGNWSGSVNIGIPTTQVAKLQVTAGSVAVDNGQGYRAFDNAGNTVNLLGITSANNVSYVGSTVSGSMQFSMPNASGGFQFFTGAGSANVMQITNAGKVGIGTTGPIAKLHVATTTSAPTDSTATMGLVVGGYDSITTGNSYAGIFGSARGGLYLGSKYTGGAINTGNIQFITGNLSTTDGNAATIASITGNQTTGDATTGGELKFKTRIPSGALTDRLIINSTGKVGIGTTSPGTDLNVIGNIAWEKSSGGYVATNHWQGNNPSVGYYAESGLLFGTVTTMVGGGWSEKMRITNTGKVGIGTTSPTAVLHLKAGTATANTAPLKLTSGTLLTTAEAGAVEFLTDDFFATITTGAARKAFVLDDGTRLTSGRIPFATTNGRLTDDADLTFATDTLTATKMVGTTSIKVGTAGGYLSSDGSAGATGTFTTVDGKTCTVKDGLITSIV